MAKGNVVVSLRSKGLASLNTANFFDFKQHLVAFSTEVIDVVLGFLLSLFLLSWSAWLSIGITIIILGVDMTNLGFLKLSPAAQEGFNQVFLTGSTSSALLLPFLAILYMPIFTLLILVFWRREQALGHLAGVKAHAVSLCLAACGDQSPTLLQRGANVIRKHVFVLLDDLHRYLHHKRPYARHFYLPYMSSPDSSAPGQDTLFRVSRELGLLLRKVHQAIRNVHGAVQILKAAGADQSHVDALSQQVLQLHMCVEQLSNIKEMRTPVILRAFIRWITVVIFPIYAGFYAINMANVTQLRGMVSVLIVFVQIVTHAMVDVTVSMEDPFDDTAMDTISLFETLDHIALMTTPDNATDPEPAGNKNVEVVIALGSKTGYGETGADDASGSSSTQQTWDKQQQQTDAEAGGRQQAIDGGKAANRTAPLSSRDSDALSYSVVVPDSPADTLHTAHVNLPMPPMASGMGGSYA